jgi:hypothetical protein
VESKPDSFKDDLRIANPFPALQEYADSFNLNTMDPKDHSHVPYVILLLKAMELYKAGADGKIPKTPQEKEAFKKVLQSLSLKSILKRLSASIDFSTMTITTGNKAAQVGDASVNDASVVTRLEVTRL